MIARCRLFSHTCVVPSSSTLSCPAALSLSVSRDPRPHVESLNLFPSLLIRHPSNAPLFFSFSFLFFLNIYPSHRIVQKVDRCFAFSSSSVPFYSPKDGSARQFFHRSAGNGIRSERKSKKVIRRRKKKDLWGEERVSLVRNAPSRDSTLFARKRFSVSRRLINESRFIYLRLQGKIKK